MNRISVQIKQEQGGNGVERSEACVTEAPVTTERIMATVGEALSRMHVSDGPVVSICVFIAED